MCSGFIMQAVGAVEWMEKAFSPNEDVSGIPRVRENDLYTIIQAFSPLVLQGRPFVHEGGSPPLQIFPLHELRKP